MIRLVYRPSPGTKLENLTVGVIQDYMVEAEKRMFAELVRDKRLGQDAYLPKDGSLEYKIMKSGREDLRTLQKIKHNYSWVIGVSKSFNPESCLDHTGKPNSNYIADLPVFQRFNTTTLIISKKPGNTGISRDIRTEFTTDLLLSD